MTEDELAEVEMHLAAGTDLPTALAALPRNGQPSDAHGCIMLPVVVAMLLVWWLFH